LEPDRRASSGSGQLRQRREAGGVRPHLLGRRHRPSALQLLRPGTDLQGLRRLLPLRALPGDNPRARNNI
ncbi:unnamed protein product, partial [Ectocarpus sp. 12 AP-2014]